MTPFFVVFLNRPRLSVTVSVALFLGAFLVNMAQAAAEPGLFPSYRAISTNVAFWEKIYSTYSVNTAIIHDREDLGRIYAAIPLTDQSKPGAQQINEALIERTKAHYADLLRRIARNGARSTEEKSVARLFGENSPAAAFTKAADNIRTQTGLRERFREGVVRSGAYLATFQKIFRAHGLPEDLAYLPHVESSFNPKALSKFGASGMWQFTVGTGKEYLQIDYMIDERRDPFRSAEAAARLLKRGYQELGSWPLALTAYNYGIAGMKRAVAEHGDYPSIFKNYRQGWFKFAARNFYPSFIAAVKVAKQLERDPSVRLDEPVPFVQFRTPAHTDSRALCRHLHIDNDILSLYNPALREPVLDGQKFIPDHYTLHLPANLKDSSLLNSLPPTIFHPAQRPSAFYRVQPGDTAGAVARNHQVSLRSLIAANGLDKNATIRVGQNLRIPTKETPQRSSVRPSRAAPAAVILNDNKKRVPEEPKPQKPVTSDRTVNGNISVEQLTGKPGLVSGRITIQPDETISLLADWSRTTQQSILLANSLKADTELIPGQVVVLDFVTASVAEFEAARFDFHQEKQEEFFNIYTVVSLTPYTVKPGDTLWDLCHNRFEIPLWLLKKYNQKLEFGQIDSASTLEIPIIKQL